MSIVTALGAVLLPRASYYVKQGMFEEFGRISSKAIHFVCLLALPLIAYFMLFATNGIHFLSGEQFDGAILPMQIILPTIFLIGLTNIIGIQILVPLGKEKEVFNSVAGGGVVDLAACLLLIPSYSVVGAAISNLLAELTVFTLQVYYVSKCRDKVNVGKALVSVEYGKIFLAIIVAIGVVWQCKSIGWKDFYVLLLSGILFFAVYGVCLYILKEKFFMELLVPVRNKLHK